MNYNVLFEVFLYFYNESCLVFFSTYVCVFDIHSDSFSEYIANFQWHMYDFLLLVKFKCFLLSKPVISSCTASLLCLLVYVASGFFSTSVTSVWKTYSSSFPCIVFISCFKSASFVCGSMVLRL